MRRSKRKELIIYAVVYCKKDYEEFTIYEDKTILSCYFSKDVALHDLIDYLNEDYNAGIKEYTEDALNDFNFKMECDYSPISYYIKEVVVNDNNDYF